MDRPPGVDDLVEYKTRRNYTRTAAPMLDHRWQETDPPVAPDILHRRSGVPETELL